MRSIVLFVLLFATNAYADCYQLPNGGTYCSQSMTYYPPNDGPVYNNPQGPGASTGGNYLNGDSYPYNTRPFTQKVPEIYPTFATPRPVR